MVKFLLFYNTRNKQVFCRSYLSYSTSPYFRTKWLVILEGRHPVVWVLQDRMGHSVGPPHAVLCQKQSVKELCCNLIHHLCLSLLWVRKTCERLSQPAGLTARHGNLPCRSGCWSCGQEAQHWVWKPLSVLSIRKHIISHSIWVS